jgi:hypothetical protein
VSAVNGFGGGHGLRQRGGLVLGIAKAQSLRQLLAVVAALLSNRAVTAKATQQLLEDAAGPGGTRGQD